MVNWPPRGMTNFLDLLEINCQLSAGTLTFLSLAKKRNCIALQPQAVMGDPCINSMSWHGRCDVTVDYLNGTVQLPQSLLSRAALIMPVPPSLVRLQGEVQLVHHWFWGMDASVLKCLNALCILFLQRTDFATIRCYWPRQRTINQNVVQSQVRDIYDPVRVLYLTGLFFHTVANLTITHPPTSIWPALIYSCWRNPHSSSLSITNTQKIISLPSMDPVSVISFAFEALITMLYSPIEYCRSD